jgi:hypothetical protein
MVNRIKDIRRIREMLDIFPVTAVLGARQCGKTTISREMNATHYFDLENPRDEARFMNPQLLLENLKGLVVIDEFQRKPELFSLLRHLVDTRDTPRYLILGSASRDLVKGSSESLAGRIGFHHLGGFSMDDAGTHNMMRLWIRGTMPRSYLAESEGSSMLWRENYITTYLERDIPQLGIMVPARTLRRFWMMLAHYHGQILNFAEIGRAFGISDMTVRRYVEILEGTYMIRVISPYFTNTSKRLVRRPKLYIRDSGIFHTLMGIGDFNQLVSNPRIGASWEGFALEETLGLLNRRSEEVFFWSTHSGAEVDLVYHHKGKLYGIEFKYADAPCLTRSMRSALNDLDLERISVIYPGADSYSVHDRVRVVSLRHGAAELP